MQAPGGQEEDTSGGFKYGGWTFPYFDDFTGKVMGEQMSKPFDLLLGRKTYDIFASYWPEHEEGWPGVNKVTKYVASKDSKFKGTWEKTVVLSEDVVSKVKKLKKEKGPDLQIYGSGNFIQTLLKNDLVDELWLKIFPVTLGNGKKLFDKGTIPAVFKLTETKISPSGVIFANYKRIVLPKGLKIGGDIKTGTF